VHALVIGAVKAADVHPVGRFDHHGYPVKLLVARVKNVASHWSHTEAAQYLSNAAVKSCATSLGERPSII
jgi:hypothetical protein